MKAIAPRVSQWSRYVPQRRRDANGIFVQGPPGNPGAPGAAGAPGALIDPVPFQQGDEAEVWERGGAGAVVLTRADRLTEGKRCGAAFGCPVLVPAGASWSRRMEGTRPYGAGEDLAGGLQVVAAGEAPALFHGPSGTAILGGAVVGAPAGELSLELGGGAPAPGQPGPAQATRALRGVLAFLLRRVLVAEGEPVLREAERAVQDLVYRHDRAAFLLRPDELLWQAPRGKGSRFLRRSAECSRLLGLKVLDFEITVVPPGKTNTLLHRHDGVEEAFIILEGEGEVLTGEEAFPVRAGDVLGFPPRYGVAHAIHNTGEGELRMLAFGVLAEPGEAVGLAEYPESGKQFQWVAGRFRRFYLPADLNVDYWEGERLD
jgi:uncharacterized cupin superfamily protein